MKTLLHHTENHCSSVRCSRSHIGSVEMIPIGLMDELRLSYFS